MDAGGGGHRRARRDQPGDRRDARARAAVGGGRPRRGRSGRAGGASGVAGGVDDRPGPQAVRAPRAARGPLRGAGAVGDDGDGQDDRRRPRRGGAHGRDGRGRVRDPDDDAGADPRGRLAQHRRRDDPAAGRGVRGDRPVQLPGDGAVLVPSVRDRVRQHVRAEALRAGAADPAAHIRGARRARAPGGRRQPRQRQPRGRRRDPRAPGHRCRVVRRLGAGGADRLRAGRQGRQARAGARRREEPYGRDARRRDRQDRRGDPRVGLRRGGAAVHGGLGRGHRRRRPRAADAAADRGHRGAPRRRWPRRAQRRRPGDLVHRAGPDPRVDRPRRGRRRERRGRRARAGRRRSERLLCRPDDPRQRHPGDGDRPRGGVRAGADA